MGDVEKDRLTGRRGNRPCRRVGVSLRQAPTFAQGYGGQAGQAVCRERKAVPSERNGEKGYRRNGEEKQNVWGYRRIGVD